MRAFPGVTAGAGFTTILFYTLYRPTTGQGNQMNMPISSVGRVRVSVSSMKRAIKQWPKRATLVQFETATDGTLGMTFPGYTGRLAVDGATVVSGSLSVCAPTEFVRKFVRLSPHADVVLGCDGAGLIVQDADSHYKLCQVANQEYRKVEYNGPGVSCVPDEQGVVKA